MKNISKRILSVLMAAIMVVASIPAISVFAYPSPVTEDEVYEYLTDKANFQSSTNMSIHSGVSWSDSENAAYFNGGDNTAYIDLTNQPFKNITPASGFTVSVDIKRNSGDKEYARIIDFSDGSTNNYFAINAGQNSKDTRYCVFTRLNNTEKRYYANGGSDGDELYTIKDSNNSNINFLSSEGDSQWHNIKVSMFKIGDAGRVFYFIDNRLYYVYSCANNFDDYLNSFKNYTHYYIGWSIFDDPNLDGYVKNLKIYKGVDKKTAELGHWTFNNTLKDTNDSNELADMQNWGGSPQNQTDHMYLRDGWLAGNAPSLMRDSRYKKNWRIDFEFNMTDTGLGANRLEHVLGISNQSGITTGYNGAQSFGMSTNGKIYFNTTDFDNGAIGDTGFNLKPYTNNKEHFILTYAYHNGVISVLLNYELKFSADVSSNSSFFENIQSFTVGGRNAVGVSMDLWDLTVYSYQETGDLDDHMKGRYFVGDVTDNDALEDYDLSTSGSGAEWVSDIDGKQAAHFLGANATNSSNYLYMPKDKVRSMLSSSSVASGMSFSFYSKSLHTDSWQRLFELTNVNAAYSGGSGNKYVMFTSQNSGSSHFRYGDAIELNNIGGVDSWHIWTVTVQEGALIVYRDGAKVSSSYNKNIDINWFREVLGSGMMLFGASTYSDAGFDGYIRDFRVYDIALSSSQVTEVYNDTLAGVSYNGEVSAEELATLLAQLKAACSAYESKMSNMGSNFLTNTKAAYDAYVVANRYIDAIEYGENTNLKKKTVKAVISDLQNKTNAMGAWSYKTATAHGRFTGDNNNVSDEDYAQTYQNVIFASEVTNDQAGATVWEPEMSIYNNDEKCDPRLYHPVAVLMYDGQKTPAMPVYSFFRHWCTAFHTYNIYYYALFIAENGNGMELRNKWHGNQNESFNFQWNYLSNGEKNVDYSDTTSMSDHKSVTFTFSSGNWQMAYANLMYFGGSMGNSEYLRTITPTWGMNFGNNGNDIKKLRVQGSKSIYVVNYKAIRDKLLAAKSTCANVANYKEGQLSTFFRGCDEATAIDPQGGYNWSKDSAGSLASNLANDISTAISHINTIDSDTTYPQLRAEMHTAHASHPTGNSAKTDYEAGAAALTADYTTSSVSRFRNAYEMARWHMSVLNDWGYDHGSTPASGRLSELVESHAGLDALADFTALDAAKDAALSEVDTSAVTAAYTTTSVANAKAYLQNAEQFPIEYTADRADTGISQNSAISAEAAKFANWKNAGYLDKVADLTLLENAYETGDTLLTGMVGKAAQYDKASVDALIEKVTDSDVSAYLDATAEQKADFGQSDESAANELAQEILDAIDGLTLVVETEIPEVDLSAYESAVNKLNNLDPDAYDSTADSISSAINGVNETVGATTDYEGDTINVVDTNASMADVNASTSRILSALTASIRHYDIVDKSGASVISEITSNNGTFEGNEATYGTTINFRTNDRETAWFLEIETSTTHKKMAFQGYGRGLSTKVLGKTTVKAVKRSETNNCRILISRDYSNDERTPVAYADFVPSGTEFEIPVAPAIAYYTFDGYYIDDNKITAASIMVTEDVEIVAKYTLNQDAGCAINATDINGDAIPSDSVMYNDKVELSGGAGTYGWIEEIAPNKFRPFYAGENVSFLATESATLLAVDSEHFNFNTPCINLRKSGVIVSGTKTIFNAQLFDAGCDVSEYGILIGAPKGENPVMPTGDQLTVENSGLKDGYTVIRAKSTRLVGANQFAIAINNLPDDFIYRGYVIYHDGTSFQTTYTDVM